MRVARALRGRGLLHAGLRQQRRPRASAARRSPAGQQRFEAAEGVDGGPAACRSLLVARQRRLHAVEVAQRAPGVSRRASRRRGPRRRARRAGGRPPAPAARAARPSARRSSSVSGGGCCGPTAPPRRQCGPRASSSASSSSRRLVRRRLAGLSRGGEPASVSASTRDAVSRSVSDTKATSCSLAPTAPNSDGQGLPVLFAAEAADQPDEVAAAEDRQLGIERVPSGTHPVMLPYDAPFSDGHAGSDRLDLVMLQRVVLGQVRFNLPGLVADARGVVVRPAARRPVRGHRPPGRVSARAVRRAEHG